MIQSKLGGPCGSTLATTPHIHPSTHPSTKPTNQPPPSTLPRPDPILQNPYNAKAPRSIRRSLLSASASTPIKTNKYYTPQVTPIRPPSKPAKAPSAAQSESSPSTSSIYRQTNNSIVGHILPPSRRSGLPL